MRLNTIMAVLAFAGVVGLAVTPAGAQTRHKRVYTNGDRTVVVTRDEDGRTHTRIIIQKRSYLDPGTTPLPNERSSLDYMMRPNQRANDSLDNTAYGGMDQEALPGPWTLPGPHNPWIDFAR
ncbi:MAG TPA: hypothetical protein VE224_17660 [Pseudolabrys sp.]|jgi:hypothetical protein|nr:hypothetical protein [Pseudolabrys sp.]